MGTTPAVPAKRGRELAELILAESGRAGLGPGSRLPTERQLAADLGVTRSGIRHALAALEADGVISREVGRGTFLSAAPAPFLASSPGAPLRAPALTEAAFTEGQGGPAGAGQPQLAGQARPSATD